MQKSVEDEKTWGGSSVALEEMGVAVLAGAWFRRVRFRWERWRRIPQVPAGATVMNNYYDPHS